MPEMLEVEAYRQLAATVLGRTIVRVDAPDGWFLKGGITAGQLADALRGHRFVADRRIGKLLLLDLDHGPTLGLRFGMTGRLLVDGRASIDHLEYSSDRDDRAWDRFALAFADGGDLRLRDPRRLGGVELDPRTDRLGIDALALTPAGLREVLGTSEAPLKARLMDQARVAGLGNLLTDEILWRAGLDPARAAGSLSPAELRRLHRHLGTTLRELGERGGSHTGDLQAMRSRDGVCPRDGARLMRRTIGGRTTYSCPVHQL
ncbi:MAG TPA: DNA-formamidopyrimidine glycosylase family protein [Acidimicrobiales bacterium]